jgi:hypothetical protein
MAQYLAARTRNAAGDASDDVPDVLGAVCVPESPPMFGQPAPEWSRGAGVAGAGVAGVVGVLGVVGVVGAVVEGVSCAEALNGFRTVSANDALAMPNAVMPVVTTFLIRCTLSFGGGFTRASCASTHKTGMKPK